MKAKEMQYGIISVNVVLKDGVVDMKSFFDNTVVNKRIRY